MSRSIKLFIVKKEESKIFDYITKENKNSLITFNEIDGKFYFKSHFSLVKEEINIIYEIISFGDDLVKKISKILKDSFDQAVFMTSEPIGPFSEPLIYSEIINYVNICSYSFDTEPESIFDFIANLFYRYLCSHKMLNGNKRLSLLFLINILRHFGYHFFWSRGLEKNYEKHHKKLEEFVIESFNLNLIDDTTKENFIKKISNWIKSNSVIALKLI